MISTLATMIILAFRFLYNKAFYSGEITRKKNMACHISYVVACRFYSLFII